MPGLVFPVGMLVPVIAKGVESTLGTVLQQKIGDCGVVQASFVIAVDIIITYPNGQQVPVDFKMSSDDVRIVAQEGSLKAGVCIINISE